MEASDFIAYFLYIFIIHELYASDPYILTSLELIDVVRVAKSG